MADRETRSPASAVEADPPPPRNVRYGLALFAVYLLLYGGFVVCNAFAPALMERQVAAGLNLAVVYGLGLIVLALALALIYGWLCRAGGNAGAKESGR
jgi:uncharacterized membrane protein (DUF485 family)